MVLPHLWLLQGMELNLDLDQHSQRKYEVLGLEISLKKAQLNLRQGYPVVNQKTKSKIRYVGVRVVILGFPVFKKKSVETENIIL